MKKTITLSFIILTLSGCTQIITAPISAAGAVAGAAIDVGSSAVGAVVGD
jgi:uncharacterized protein YceK